MALAILVFGNVYENVAFADDGTMDVTDFGAVGNGIADDRAAIQTAINTAAANGGGVVYFPEGDYRVEEIIQLKSNVSLQLDDDATIINGINISGHPSIIFMTGPFTNDGEQVTWARTENISISGGTIDMNGELSSDGSYCNNLPNIGSSGAFAIGYSDNFTIEDVTFKNSYKGHAIQICACNGVEITDCTFVGQALPNYLTDSQIINLETIQIEPSTTNGFPYASNNTYEAARNVTISGCYFGASNECGEPVTAIGTHNQVPDGQKCNNIWILNNTFSNMVYSGLRFCGYEDVVIRGNVFNKGTSSQSVNYRENGCYLINAYCYNNTTDTMDLNKRITIDNNSFYIADVKTRPIRVARDKEEISGTVSDITITNNTIVNTSSGSTDVGIHALRISSGLIITGNSITGGYRGIEVQNCSGSITISNNAISGLDYQYVRIIGCGDYQKINLFTHGCGTINMVTANGKYTFTAVPNSGYTFDAYYGENALETLITRNISLTYNINKTTNVSRHPLFVAE